jgi:hypothetical protein
MVMPAAGGIEAPQRNTTVGPPAGGGRCGPAGPDPETSGRDEAELPEW